MKRYVKYILIFIVLLVLADQGAKLLMEQYSSITENVGTVHLHPRVNTADLEKFTQMAEDGFLTVPVLFVLDMLKRILLTAVCCTAMYWISRGLDSIGRPMYGIASAFITLMVSSTVCVGLDYILRQGSLDWFCISRALEAGRKVMHITLDLKDLYLLLFLAVDVVIIARLFLRGITDKSFIQDVENGLNGLAAKLKKKINR